MKQNNWEAGTISVSAGTAAYRFLKGEEEGKLGLNVCQQPTEAEETPGGCTATTPGDRRRRLSGRRNATRAQAARAVVVVCAERPAEGGEGEPPSPPRSATAEARLLRSKGWDAAYERELQTFQDTGDAGEIWFGEESMIRLIRWMQKRKIPLDSSVLDIGTGNGVLLVELAKSGYTNLTGIDYSPSAIQLSEKVKEKEGMSNIKFQVEDFLALSAELSGFQICIDKGTFDAISLNPENAVGKRKQYVRSLCSVLKPEGFFLITSCNWTKEELLNEFREGFEILEELPTPKFCFGGRIGNSVTALVFQRKKVEPSILDKLD
nr:PREDICTED: methyltransferase-like protein 10 [Struthio camelus australis]